MPEDRLKLEEISGAITGQEQKREVRQFEDGPPVSKINYGKLILRDEWDLQDKIECDFNPTEWPFSIQVNYNDKAVIGGTDALEFKSRKEGDFALNLLFTDYGYYTAKKTFKDTVDWKIKWLIEKTKTWLGEVDDKFVDNPPVIMLEKGLEAFRVVILKLEWKEVMQDFQFTPIRATVVVHFRKIWRRRQRKKRGGGRNF
jgi:hypothetical protein